MEKIKVGEMYNIRVRVFALHKNLVTVTFVDGDDSSEVLIIPSRRMSILTPSTPKHDHKRKVKKGAESESRPKAGRVKPNKIVIRKEDLKPYSVGGGIDECIVYKNDEYYAEFTSSIEAEQVCKLLNAMHRKDNQ